MTKSNTPVSTELVISNLPSTADIDHAIRHGLKLSIDNEGVGEAAIVARVANATSVEDVFGGGSLTAINDILGTSLRIDAIESVRPSDYASESGLGIYLVVKAVDVDGEVHTLAVGSTDAIVKLVKLAELGALPRWVAFEKATKATKSGYFPVNMVDRHREHGERF